LAVALSGTRPKLMLSEHTLLSEWWGDDRLVKYPIDRAMRYIMPWAYLGADAIVGVSSACTHDLRRLVWSPPERVHCLYNPVVAPRLRALAEAPLDPPWPDDGRALILGVGRLEASKGFDLLLEAFARLGAETPARLALVGAGPELEALEARAALLGISEHVHFLAFQANPYAWMRRADVLAVPSFNETFPTVVLEAMAVGTPVVSFDCPYGPREIITHGLDGLLVPPEDPAALAEGLRRVLHDAALAARLREGGAQRSQDFTIARTIQAYERLFTNLLAA
jgi:glycosyltransferase involved in cell wall biosynthesis